MSTPPELPTGAPGGHAPASKRLTIDFSPATTLRLETLKEKLEAPSHVDDLRTALKVLEAAAQAKKRGAELVIIEKDGTERGAHLVERRLGDVA